jgi:FlaG/FlaF family flagellin (archaellin)
MVAITVILAAVIGAFVLEIGDQQETAPSTSFDSGQETRFFECGGCSATANFTTVTINHAGGSTIDESQVDLSINGNTSVYDIVDHNNGQKDRVIPINYQSPTENAEWKSGQSKRSVAYAKSDPAGDWYSYARALDDGGPSPSKSADPLYYKGHDDATIKVFDWASGDEWNAATHGPPTDADDGPDTIRVVWEASSGGKTQTLFRYSVQ